MSLGSAFVQRSRAFLGEYVTKIDSATAGLTAQQLWWRPNEASNSVGNLLLHLAGNVRQWIVSGVGGEPDVRRRQEEFDARSGGAVGGLLAELKRAVAEADRVLAGLDPDRLDERRAIQGREPTVMEAIYHVVEHFSGHTFQILYIAKLLTARDLGFYSAGGQDRWQAGRAGGAEQPGGTGRGRLTHPHPHTGE